MIDQNEGHQTPFTLALHGGLYIAIILDQNEEPQILLTIA
jgi:hypothetical protein